MENDEQYFDDPEPLDEDDPAVLEEMFEMHKYRGVKPEELTGATPEYRQKYADWLESQKA
jgi:hypothetical protein